MGVSILFLLLAVAGIAGFAIWMLALLEVLRTPDEVWREAGQDRLVWALVVVFLSFVGAVLFLLIARPQLERVRARPIV
jgi:hypothetical protein